MGKILKFKHSAFILPKKYGQIINFNTTSLKEKFGHVESSQWTCVFFWIPSWTSKMPITSTFQVTFGLISDTYISTYIYEENLFADGHLQCLRSYLTVNIDNSIPLNRSNNTWFQHDSDPPHNARKVADYLVQTWKMSFIKLYLRK